MILIVCGELSLIFILFGIWYMPLDQEAGDSIGASGLSMLTGVVGFMLLVIALFDMKYAGGYLMENNKRSE